MVFDSTRHAQHFTMVLFMVRITLRTCFGLGNAVWVSGEHFGCGNALGFRIDALVGTKLGKLGWWGSKKVEEPEANLKELDTGRLWIVGAFFLRMGVSKGGEIYL